MIKKTSEEKKIKKEKSINKKKVINNKKKKEFIFCLIVVVIFCTLVVLSINNIAFLPACLISLGLELFSICYYYIDDKDKKILVYSLFIIGLFLVLGAVIYTMIRIA